ncbi:hypothetical protein I3843_03G256100 [Carya illinoinensis]|nr:hypothetical protein I3843_03G256100 [Carya illinoinensis]
MHFFHSKRKPALSKRKHFEHPCASDRASLLRQTSTIFSRNTYMYIANKLIWVHFSLSWRSSFTSNYQQTKNVTCRAVHGCS